MKYLPCVIRHGHSATDLILINLVTATLARKPESGTLKYRDYFSGRYARQIRFHL